MGSEADYLSENVGADYEFQKYADEKERQSKLSHSIRKEVQKTIKCNNECPLGKFDGCCQGCPDHEGCEEACEFEPGSCGDAIFDEATGLTAFETQGAEVIKQITDICTRKKQLEEMEKQLKSDLREAMELYGVKKFVGEGLTITYIAATTSTAIDSAKLKKKYPDIAAECSKTSDKAAYIKIDTKGVK